MARTIDIKEQPRLGIARTLAMTFNGMRHRVVRSIITVMVITVAIAFMMNTVGESLLKHGVAQSISQRILDMRLTSRWHAMLSQPPALEALISRIADAPTGGQFMIQSQRFSDFDDDQMFALHATVTQADLYLTWFERLNYGQRRRLAHTASGSAIFDRLGSAQTYARFDRGLSAMTSIRLPTQRKPFDDFLVDWPMTKKELTQIQAGHQRAVDRITRSLTGDTLMDALRQADGAFGDVIRDAGFELDDAIAVALSQQGMQQAMATTVEATLAHLPIRQALATKLDLLPGEVEVKQFWPAVRHRRDARWFLDVLTTHNMAPTSLTADELAAMARRKRIESALIMASRAGADATDDSSHGRLIWLVIVSMVVCVVGITNAMLMTVTQRFREIATLKCLGALDGYIATAFILEACMLGVVGGAIGALAGTLIAMMRMFGEFGRLLESAISVPSLFGVIGLAIAVGVLLAAVATVLPAVKAARLVPMQAMRVE